MRPRHVLAAAGVAAVLAAGGVASAQTTDPPTTDPPTTEAPAAPEERDGHCDKDARNGGDRTPEAAFRRL